MLVECYLMLSNIEFNKVHIEMVECWCLTTTVFMVRNEVMIGVDCLAAEWLNYWKFCRKQGSLAIIFPINE